jgi:D-tyrosyl-tRNA(Tyr) deacylase
VASIGAGLLVLCCVERDDDGAAVDYMADKTAALRIFPDEDGKMNRGVVETGGEILVVSQFTLAARTRKGRRPSYTDAAAPDAAIPLYELYVKRLRSHGLTVATGVFQAMMEVELVNDGPVTVMLEPPAGSSR